MADNISKVLDALAPDASTTKFPYPKLVTSFGSSGVHVSEGPIINGNVMPGQWLLQELTRVFGWEMRQGNYLTGATLVPSQATLSSKSNMPSKSSMMRTRESIGVS